VPGFRKLSTSEVNELSRRQTNLADLSEYMDYLKSLKPGDWGAIDLAEGESQRTVKRRASTAATSLNKKLKWRANRGNDQGLVFQLQNLK
jgi:hypothetical protein